jgi:hypothetical protein
MHERILTLASLWGQSLGSNVQHLQGLNRGVAPASSDPFGNDHTADRSP